MKTILILLTLLLLPIALNAQTECKNDISTNSAAPANPNTLPGNSSLYLNHFNWLPTVIVDGVEQTGSYVVNDMMVNNNPITQLNSIAYNGMSYYNYLVFGPRSLPENGWELLSVNLGRYPDDQTLLSSTNASWQSALPYIVLYNRYSGIIRVFVSFGTDFVEQGPDAVEITLAFAQNVPGLQVSGLLSLNEGIGQSLDDLTDITVVKSIAKANTNGNQWTSTDFQITYDPCTCYNPSILNLSFKLISTSSIKLEGRGVTTEEDLTSTNLSVIQEEFLSNFDYSSGTQSESGMILYKHLEKAIDDYIKKLEKYQEDLLAVQKHNAKVNRNLIILKAVQLMTGAGVTFGASTTTNPSTTNVNPKLKKIDTSKPAEVNMFNDLMSIQEQLALVFSNGEKYVNTKKIFTRTKEILGEGGKTFIANNFELKKNPTPPAKPSVSLNVSHYSGEITTDIDKGGYNFYTPGTFGSSVPNSPVPQNFSHDQYPVYNEVLGVFSLLESPKLKISKVLGGELVESDIISYSNGCLSASASGTSYRNLYQHHQSWTNNYQITLEEDLKYAINDVLDIKDYSIRASFNIKANPKLLSNPTDFHKVNLFNAPNSAINIESTNIDLAEFDKIRARSYPYNYYNNTIDPLMIELASCNSNFFDVQAHADSDIINTDIEVEYQTPTLPINAFKSMVSAFGLRNEMLTYKYHDIPPQNNGQDPMTVGYEYDFEIELKLVIDIEFNSVNTDGVTNKTTLLLTYPVDVDNDVIWSTSPIVSGLAASSANFAQYPEDFAYPVTHFAGQQVEGCELVGNHYTCKAWNDITIYGDISTASGYSVEFIAGNEIEVLPEADITPEVILKVEPVLDYSDPMPQATQTEVTAFCQNSNLYKANTPRSGLANSNLKPNNNVSNPEDIQINMDFYLYPNPTNSDRVTLQLLDGIRNDTPFEIVLHDLSGRLIQVRSESIGSNTYIIDLSGLESGTYFITGSTYGHKITKRLIVQ